MTIGETKHRLHADAARKLLAEADHTLMTQDLPLTGEKLWQATVCSVKALCASRGWECTDHDYAQQLDLVKRFAEERDDETIKLSFLIAGHCHANFRYDWMEFDVLNENSARIRQLVEKLLAEVE